MKRFAAFLLLLVSALAGAARWLDVVNYTDLDTGFVTWGPAWARWAPGPAPGPAPAVREAGWGRGRWARSWRPAAPPLSAARARLRACCAF